MPRHSFEWVLTHAHIYKVNVLQRVIVCVAVHFPVCVAVWGGSWCWCWRVWRSFVAHTNECLHVWIRACMSGATHPRMGHVVLCLRVYCSHELNRHSVYPYSLRELKWALTDCTCLVGDTREFSRTRNYTLSEYTLALIGSMGRQARVYDLIRERNTGFNGSWE